MCEQVNQSGLSGLILAGLKEKNQGLDTINVIFLTHAQPPEALVGFPGHLSFMQSFSIDGHFQDLAPQPELEGRKELRPRAPTHSLMLDLEVTWITLVHSPLASICHTPLLIYKQPEKCREDTGGLGWGVVLLPLPHQENATLGGELRRNDAEIPLPGIIN